MTRYLTESTWNKSRILWIGMLGDEAGERYQKRCLLALLLFIGAEAAAAFALMPFVAPLRIALPGVTFVYIAWQMKRYLAEADELARRMHLEAMAYTYLVAMAVCMTLGGFGKPVHPGLLILFDLVRAGFLYRIARRYE